MSTEYCISDKPDDALCGKHCAWLSAITEFLSDVVACRVCQSEIRRFDTLRCRTWPHQRQTCRTLRQ